MIEGNNEIVDGLNIVTIKRSSVVWSFCDDGIIFENIRLRIKGSEMDYYSLLIKGVSSGKNGFISSNSSFTQRDEDLIIRGAKIEDGILIIDKHSFVTVKDNTVIICKGSKE